MPRRHRMAGVQDFAAEVAQHREVRKVRNSACSGRHDDVSRTYFPLGAVRPMQHNGPSLFAFVVGPALEFRAGPIAELHAFHIGLEPAGKLIFGDIGRPVRWKRHVRKVVDLHLIVQRQRVITVAPVVTDTLLAVYDQSIDL